jgi:exopolysaccharide production protein ExoQ
LSGEPPCTRGACAARVSAAGWAARAQERADDHRFSTSAVMSPLFAAFLTAVFVLWLLLQDWRRTHGTTPALWVPLTWLTIISSRYVSEWIDSAGASSLQDGSPVDQPVFLGLILAAVVILARRDIPWSQLPAGNIVLILFLAYGAASILWSDFPFIAFKRWIKVVGHSLMVLVVLSEPRPREAMRALFRRCGYMLIPASILLIKYFPE